MKTAIELSELNYESWCGTRWLCLKECKSLSTERLLWLLGLMKDGDVEIVIPSHCVWGTQIEIRRWLRREYYLMAKRHSVVELVHLHHTTETAMGDGIPVLMGETHDEWDEVLMAWASHIARKVKFIIMVRRVCRESTGCECQIG
jgi:hypothetical protein